MHSTNAPTPKRKDATTTTFNEDREEVGLALNIIGWQVLAVDFLVIVFVPEGLRNGSMFWLWWTVLGALVAVVLFIAAHRIKADFWPASAKQLTGARR